MLAKMQKRKKAGDPVKDSDIAELQRKLDYVVVCTYVAYIQMYYYVIVSHMHAYVLLLCCFAHTQVPLHAVP